MRPIHMLKAAGSLAVGSALFLAACGEASPVDPMASPQALVVDPYSTVTVCVVGPTGTYDYDITAPAGKGTFPLGTSFTLGDGDCQIGFVRTETEGSSDPLFTVTATQTGAPTDVVLDSVVVNSQVDGTTKTSGPSGDATVNGFHSATITFYNTLVPPPPSGEGCTPGFWKQSHHFDDWPAGYAPTDLFSAYFEDAFPGMSLLDVLGQGGGGLKALGRHTVAALLNAAAGLDYGMDVTGVIDAFNDVYPGGDYEGQKNIFAAGNEAGCPF